MFVGEDVYSYDDIKDHIVYENCRLTNSHSQPEIGASLVSTSRGMLDSNSDLTISEDITGNMSTFDYERIGSGSIANTANANNSLDYQHDIFISTVNEAIKRLSHDELRQFILFATGSTLFKKSNDNATKITISARIFTFNASNSSNSSTISASLNKDIKSYPQWPLPKAFTCFNQVLIPYFNSNQGVNISSSSNANISRLEWNAQTVYENIKLGLHYIDEFSDSNVLT